MGSDVTAGTLTVEPTINGTDAADDLDLSLTSGGTANNAYASVEPGVITFTAGQTLGVHLTTDGTFAPTNQNIKVILDVIYN